MDQGTDNDVDTKAQDTDSIGNLHKRKLKILGLDEPYEHAPLKPDGDPWAILLKPELEADKIRCDAWKEEVQTLLIFAGLFSAVVTAFVIEWYKFLQPGPNDAIISLLFQIANGPNTTSSTLSPGSSTSFAQKSSSVRVNVFWFLSLILSLATVLVGTIALQWLREHQSYPGFSPKEMVAILHMRTLALEAWYVPQIFAALPLLLQGALVLFLVGLIDFTLPLGAKLAIPVCCVIGVILLFLAVTTILPAFQPVFLLSGLFSREHAPIPCAFKSPQSQAFRTLSGYLLHLLSFIFPTVYLPEPMFYWRNNILPNDSDQRHLFPYIYTVWYRKTWPTHDLEWLSLRDAWHQGILDKDSELDKHRRRWKTEFPLSDITRCVVKAIAGPTSAKHTEEYLVTAYYCFQELSASIWGSKYRGSIWRRIDRRNNYFEQLHQDDPPDCSIAKFLIHGGTYDDARTFAGGLDKVYIRDYGTLFQQDQNSLFLESLLDEHASPPLRRHQQEMGSRLLQYLLKGGLQPLIPLPNYQDSESRRSNPILRLAHVMKSDYSGSVVLLATTFERVAPFQRKQEASTNPLYTHGSMCDFLHALAENMDDYIEALESNYDTSNPNASNQLYLHDIGKEYNSIFRSVAKQLSDELSPPEMSTPSLLFYFSAVFLHHLLFWREFDSPEVNDNISGLNFTPGLSDVLHTLFRYKQSIAGRENEETEAKFKGMDWIANQIDKSEHWQVVRFSDEWWAGFSRLYDDSGLRVAENHSTLPSSTLRYIALPSPTCANESHAPTRDIMPLSSADTADNVVSSSSALNLDMPPVSNAILDIPPPVDIDDHAHGASTRPPASSSPPRSPTFSEVANKPSFEPPPQIVASQFKGLPSKLPAQGDGPPRNLAISSGDSVIDIQPPGVLDESGN